MKPQLTIIRSLQGLLDLEEYLKDKEYVAYDSETTGLTKSDEVIGYSVCAEEDKAFYVVLAEWRTNQLVYNPLYDVSVNFLKTLQTKKLVMHNSVFDCMMAAAFFKVDLMPSMHTDTMILAQLLDENRKVALKDLAASMFGESSKQEQKEMKESVTKNGGSLTKDKYELYKADSELLGKYGAKDALLTYKLFLALVPELYAQGLDKFFYEDESMPLLKGPTFDLNTTGLQVDNNELTSLKKQLQAECEEAKAFIYEEINSYIKTKYPGTSKKTTFNIGSSQQLSWLLFGELKLEFGNLTDEGKVVCKAMDLKIPYVKSAKNHFVYEVTRREGEVYQFAIMSTSKKKKDKKIKSPWAYTKCDKAALFKHVNKYEWIAVLLEYQKKMKLLSTYVKGVESRVQYGIIRPSFDQKGTKTGRYSSKNPNFQNLPRDDKRVKRFITSRPGKVFVGADYSQLEPRVFAFFSKDERLLAAFRGSDDFYSVIGMESYSKFDCIPKKDGSPDAFGIKYKRLRDESKVIALSATYGTTAFKLSGSTGKSIDETKQIIDNYFEKFPKVKAYQLDSHSRVKTEGFVTNLFGRRRRIPEAKAIPAGISHSNLPYVARNLLNISVNFPIQSTGASIVNRASIRFYGNCKKAGIVCKLVLQVHDSLVVECDEADAPNVAVLLQDAMENAVTLEGINLEAIPKIGKNLAEV